MWKSNPSSCVYENFEKGKVAHCKSDTQNSSRLQSFVFGGPVKYSFFIEIRKQHKRLDLWATSILLRGWPGKICPVTPPSTACPSCSHAQIFWDVKQIMQGDCATFTTPTFTTPDIHHPQCKMRHSPPPTFTTPDVHHPQCKLRHSSPPTFTTPDIHHPRHSPPPCKMRRSSPPNLGQFGTGTNLAPLPIWHQECKGVNLTLAPIWHRHWFDTIF